MIYEQILAAMTGRKTDETKDADVSMRPRCCNDEPMLALPGFVRVFQCKHCRLIEALDEKDMRALERFYKDA